MIKIFKIIFLFLVLSKKKFFYFSKKIKILSNLDKFNVLVSSPSSGSTFVRLVISSYYELLYRYGNGIPKYNPHLNKDIFSLSPIVMGNYKNEFSLDKLDKEDLLFLKNNSKRLIFFSRFPLGNKDNIFNIKKSKIIVLVRDPYNEILSSSVKKIRDLKDSQHVQNVLDEKIFNYEKYISYWKKYYEEKKDIKIIKFDEIENKPFEVLKIIFEFFNYPINVNLINTSINLHSIKTTNERMKNIEKPKYQRYSNKDIRADLKKKFSRYILSHKSYLKSLEIFEEIKNNL